MKNILKSILALGAVFAVVSCNVDAIGTLYEHSGSDTGVTFAKTVATDTEMPAMETVYAVPVTRAVADAAQTVSISTTLSSDIVVPGSVSFAAGEYSTDLVLDISGMSIGTTYRGTISLADESAFDANTAISSMSVSLAKAFEWEPFGTGYWVDNTMRTYWGVDEDIAMYVDVEKAVSAAGEHYRFASPFAKVATAVDKYGAYNGYPYNDEGDIVSGTYYFIINVSGTDASLNPVNLGIDWGYGMQSIGTIYGNISSSTAYPLGKYDAAAGMITFGANSLYFSDNDGPTPVANPSYFFLNAAAFEAWLKQ